MYVCMFPEAVNGLVGVLRLVSEGKRRACHMKKAPCCQANHLFSVRLVLVMTFTIHEQLQHALNYTPSAWFGGLAGTYVHLLLNCCALAVVSHLDALYICTKRK